MLIVSVVIVRRSKIKNVNIFSCNFRCCCVAVAVGGVAAAVVVVAAVTVVVVVTVAV